MVINEIRTPAQFSFDGVYYQKLSWAVQRLTKSKIFYGESDP